MTTGMAIFIDLPSLKLTANAPENRPFAPKRKGESIETTIHFLGAMLQAVSFREGMFDSKLHLPHFLVGSSSDPLPFFSTWCILEFPSGGSLSLCS